MRVLVVEMCIRRSQKVNKIVSRTVVCYRGVWVVLNIEGTRSFALSVRTKISYNNSREGAEVMIAIHCWMGISNAIY